jgi:hypothetical protein
MTKIKKSWKVSKLTPLKINIILMVFILLALTRPPNGRPQTSRRNVEIPSEADGDFGLGLERASQEA